MSTSTSESTQPIDKTRRRLAFGIGAGLVSLFLGHKEVGERSQPPVVSVKPIDVSDKPKPVHETATSTPSINPDKLPEIPTSVYTYNGETIEVEPEAQRMIDGVLKDFGVQILIPAKWEDTESGFDNQIWSTYEIALVAQAISQLPPTYIFENRRSPLQILLIKKPGSQSEGAGGGYTQRHLALYISETFAPELAFRDPNSLFKSQGDHLRSLVMHEWTHSFTEAEPEILLEWRKATDWVYDFTSNTWVNSSPEDIPDAANARLDPVEDIAVSAQLMLVNPEILCHKRKNFFVNHPRYQTWPTIVDLKAQSS